MSEQGDPLEANTEGTDVANVRQACVAVVLHLAVIAAAIWTGTVGLRQLSMGGVVRAALLGLAFLVLGGAAEVIGEKRIPMPRAWRAIRTVSDVTVALVILSATISIVAMIALSLGAFGGWQRAQELLP